MVNDLAMDPHYLAGSLSSRDLEDGLTKHFGLTKASDMRSVFEQMMMKLFGTLFNYGIYAAKETSTWSRGGRPDAHVRDWV